MPYDLETFHVPTLAGKQLKTFTKALELPYAGNLLNQTLAKQLGIGPLRQRHFSEAPTLHPLHPNKTRITKGAAATTLKQVLQQEQLQADADAPFETLADFAAAYRSGESDPEAVATRLLREILHSNNRQHPINAVIQYNENDIKRQAEASAKRFQQGKPLSVLDGVPVAVKDEVDAHPYPTTMGSRAFVNQPVAATDATIVERLRAAGAIIIGKTNMHEIGLGVTGANQHFGPCRNPYRPSHHTGGSSSGSAAAVAAGLCPIAVAADAGGSIRIPAALCGLVGLKATWGRISLHGAAHACWSTDHVGPIGSCVDDVAVAYAISAGPDKLDEWTQQQPPVHLSDYRNEDLSGVRIGIYEPWFSHASQDIVRACRRQVETLVSLGAEVVNVVLDDLDLQRVAHALTVGSEMLASVEQKYRDNPDYFSLETRVNLAISAAFSSRDYVRAQQVRTRCLREFHTLFKQVDVIATPTTAITAPRINERTGGVGESNLSILSELMRFVFPGNFTGYPAITSPAGYDEKGLPIGFQLMARPWEEHLLLRLAKALEKRTEWHRPVVHYHLLER